MSLIERPGAYLDIPAELYHGTEICPLTHVTRRYTLFGWTATVVAMVAVAMVGMIEVVR